MGGFINTVSCSHKSIHYRSLCFKSIRSFPLKPSKSSIASQSMEVLGQSKLTLLLLFAICMLVPLTQAIDVKYCDKKGNYDVKVQGVKISPSPVASGKPATFNVSASTGQAISGGKVVIDVSYFGVHVHTETHDLCEEISCPITLGDFVLSHTQTLPGFTPPGSYTLKMRMVDGSNHQLTCFSFNFSIGLGSSVSDS